VNREDITVIVGGVIPEKDYEELYKCGVSLIFGPGTPIPTAAATVVKEISKRLQKTL